jgi:hypothetical protein
LALRRLAARWGSSAVSANVSFGAMPVDGGGGTTRRVVCSCTKTHVGRARSMFVTGDCLRPRDASVAPKATFLPMRASA